MSTTLENAGTGKFVDFDEYIDFQLAKTRAGVKSTDLLTTLAGVGSLVLGYILVFTLFDHWVVEGGFSRTTRALMLIAVVAASIGWITWKIVLPWWRSVNALYAARLIEQAAPELNSSLLNLIDLQRADKLSNPAIRRALEKRSAQQLARIDVDHAIDRRALLMLTYLLLALVTVFCLYAIFSPKPISFLRPLTAANIPVATRTQIVEVTPGSTRVLVREPVEIRAVVRGKPPAGVAMFYTTADGAFADERLEMSPIEGDPGVYELLFHGENGNGLTQSVSYYVTAGDARSETYQLQVLLAPSANVTQVDYRYPEYMELEPRTQYVPAIDAWEGTEATVRAASPDVPVASAVLQLFDEKSLGRAIELPADIAENGTDLTATWKLLPRPDGSFPTRYRIVCTSEEGTVDPEPAEHQITVRPDVGPEVALLDPTGDLERPANAVVPLLFKARDPDFQIAYVTLRVSKDGEELTSLPLFEGRKQVVLDTYRWDLAPLGLKGGDEITFHIEARDNKHPSGNRKSSPSLKLRIVEPAAPQQNEEQLAQDEARQQDKLREEQAEAGESQTPGDKTDDATNDGQADDEPKPSENQDDGAEGDPSDDPKQTGENTDKPQDGREANPGKSPNGANSKDKPQPEPGGEDSQPEDGNPDPNAKPLDAEGNDDAEALDKILERQRQQEPSPPSADGNDARPEDAPGAAKPEPSNDGQSDDNPPPSADSDEMPPANAEQDPGAEGTGAKSNDPSNQPPMSTRPGEASDPASSKPNDSPGAKDEQPNETPGDTKPADPNDSPAKTRPGDPNATGTAKPADKPDPDATRLNDPDSVQREPGTAPTTTPSKDPRDPKSPPPDDGNTADPRNNRPSDPMRPRKPNGEANQPPGPDEPSKGPGNPEAQKSRNPSDGEDGSSQQNSDGTPGDKGKGNADPSTDPGNTRPNPDGSKPGQPGSQKGPGSTDSENPDGQSASPEDGQKPGSNSKPAADSPGAGAKPGESDSNAGKSDTPGERQGKPGANGAAADGQNSDGGTGEHGPNAKGPGSGTSSAKPGSPSARPAANGAGATPGERDGQQSSATPANRSEEQNLEHAKQAADLVLRKLERDLARGEVDEELLKELGWTPEQMQQFADRMRKLLDRDTADLSAEERVKQRQFEEMLKSFKFDRPAAQQAGTKQPPKTVNGFGARKLPVPLEYREYIDAVTRDLGKQTTESRD